MPFRRLLILLAVLLISAVSASALEFAPVPLDSYANLAPASSDLLAPPRKGSDFQRIDGVQVRLVSLARGSKTQLAVGLMGDQPTAVRGIPIGYSGVKALHFFHSVLRGSPRSGSFVCKYVLHYQSGKIAEIPVVVGQDTGSSRVAQGVPRAKAIQAVVDDDPRPSFVYHMVWRNPYPKDRLATMDVIAVSPSALVGLTALSVELLPLRSVPARLSRDASALARLWRDFQSQSESAAISLLSGDYPAATNRSLREVIEAADAASVEVLSLRKALRTAAETGGAAPKDLRSRISALSNKRNSIQVTLTKAVRNL